MKCLICKEKTDKRILCPKHIGVDACLKVMTIHKCESFKQKKDEMDGTCEHYLICTPIKKALQHEMLIGDLGHVICPYASTNLTKAVYSQINEDEVRANYSECL